MNFSIKNGNKYNPRIKNIRCEMTLIKCDCKIVKTLQLAKNETLLLKKGEDEYTYYTMDNWSKDKYSNLGSPFEALRIRLVASNFIGVQKYTECYFKISEIPREKVYVKAKERKINPCAIP